MFDKSCGNRATKTAMDKGAAWPLKAAALRAMLLLALLAAAPPKDVWAAEAAKQRKQATEYATYHNMGLKLSYPAWMKASRSTNSQGDIVLMAKDGRADQPELKIESLDLATSAEAFFDGYIASMKKGCCPKMKKRKNVAVGGRKIMASINAKMQERWDIYCLNKGDRVYVLKFRIKGMMTEAAAKKIVQSATIDPRVEPELEPYEGRTFGLLLPSEWRMAESDTTSDTETVYASTKGGTQSIVVAAEELVGADTALSAKEATEKLQRQYQGLRVPMQQKTHAIDMQKIGGRDCVHLAAEVGTARQDIYLLREGKTMYALTYTAEATSRDEGLLQRVRESFWVVEDEERKGLETYSSQYYRLCHPAEWEVTEEPDEDNDLLMTNEEATFSCVIGHYDADPLKLPEEMDKEEADSLGRMDSTRVLGMMAAVAGGYPTTCIEIEREGRRRKEWLVYRGESRYVIKAEDSEKDSKEMEKVERMVRSIIIKKD